MARCQYGFSLLELMAVLLIITILSFNMAPGVTSSWEQFILKRHAEQMLVQVNFLRHIAITSERGTVLSIESMPSSQNSTTRWCGRYEGEPDGICSLLAVQIPARLYVRGLGVGSQVFNFTSGRGFSPLASGRIRLYSNAIQEDTELIISSLGRARLCTSSKAIRLPACA